MSEEQFWSKARYVSRGRSEPERFPIPTPVDGKRIKRALSPNGEVVMVGILQAGDGSWYEIRCPSMGELSLLFDSEHERNERDRLRLLIEQEDRARAERKARD